MWFTVRISSSTVVTFTASRLGKRSIRQNLHDISNNRLNNQEQKLLKMCLKILWSLTWIGRIRHVWVSCDFHKLHDCVFAENPLVLRHISSTLSWVWSCIKHTIMHLTSAARRLSVKTMKIKDLVWRRCEAERDHGSRRSLLNNHHYRGKSTWCEVVTATGNKIKRYLE